MRGAHVTVGAAAEARRCLLAVPFPFRRGRHGRSIAYTVPLRGHSKREFSKASCVVETAAWFAARRHFRPVVKSTVSQLRAAFSNTEFRPGGGRDCVANYWQSNPEDTDGPSIKFWWVTCAFLPVRLPAKSTVTSAKDPSLTSSRTVRPFQYFKRRHVGSLQLKFMVYTCFPEKCWVRALTSCWYVPNVRIRFRWTFRVYALLVQWRALYCFKKKRMILFIAEYTEERLVSYLHYCGVKIEFVYRE